MVYAPMHDAAMQDALMHDGCSYAGCTCTCNGAYARCRMHAQCICIESPTFVCAKCGVTVEITNNVDPVANPTGSPAEFNVRIGP